MSRFVDIQLPRFASRILARGMQDVVWHGPRSARGIALTFDDGPTRGTTEHVLESLDRHDAKATFFMLGEAMQRHPDLAREVAARGHSLGFHGHAHVDGWRASTGRLEGDFERGLRVFEDVTSERPLAYRPPHGHLRPALLRLARTNGLPVAMWDVLCGDFRQSADPHRLLPRNLRATRCGSILVLHDRAPDDLTFALLDPLLDQLRTAGHPIIPLSTFLP